MALSQAWTDQTAVANSSTTTVTANQIVSYEFDSGTTGWVWVEALMPNPTGSGYVEIEGSKRNVSGAFPLVCPDPSVTYRFGGARIEGTVRCYMGP